MSLEDDNNEYTQHKFNRSRGKCGIYAREPDVYLELKSKPKTNAWAPIPEMNSIFNNINFTIDIQHDAWFQIALRLDPEDVQRFALVCTQFNNVVSSKAFWRNMCRRYCLGGSTKGWNLQLPGQLQLGQFGNCDKKALRSIVIEALFHCYRPFKTRLELGYSLDWLLQRQFISCSQKQYQCLWIICYTLRSKSSKMYSTSLPEQMCIGNEDVYTDVVNDWESLAEDEDNALPLTYSGNRHDGAVLLIVLCRQFMPLPLQLLYNQQQSRFRLKATREMLCTDMRAKNLELDFVEDESNSQLSITVKYSCIEKYKVLPWWHPDFKRFLK